MYERISYRLYGTAYSKQELVDSGPNKQDGYVPLVALTNPKSQSKSDLETHFPTNPPPPQKKVDRVQLGLPIGNQSYLSMLVELTKGS